ncbi:MAG: glycerophosphodiester phosphodiesterase family protein [Microbacterium sp.]
MLIIAHRGAWAETGLPEQTRASFEAALHDVGADGVECDVRLTADGELVCHHDATAERLTRDPRAISESTLAQLRALDWDATTDLASGGIVTLAELIDICRAAARPVVLAIELKHPNPAGTAVESAVLEVLAASGWDAATSTIGEVRVSLMSFNPESLPVLLPVVPGEHVTLLTAEAALDDIAYAVDTTQTDAATYALLEAQLVAALAAGRRLIEAGAVGGVGPDIATVRDDPSAVARWVEAGRAVRVWTVDDYADADLCADLGVQQLETDRPRALLAWRDARRNRA